jgi:signal peptidase I
MNDTRTPNRALAALLAFALPPGVGHAYLGRTRRGILWAVACFVLWLGGVATTATVTSGLGGRAALALMFGAIALRWIAPVVDVLVIPRARFGPTNMTALVVLLSVGVAVALATSIGVRVLLLEAFKIPSGAMMPTLLIGDHVFTDKLVYRTRPPRRGEVMVFAFPEHPDQDFIKRVVALPGDELVVHAGHPWLNGWEVPHCMVGRWSYTEPDYGHHEGELDVEFLDEQAYLTFYDAASGAFPEQQGPYHVKGGEYWVMGDNRNNSHDSRMWYGGMGGGVPRDLVRAHALVVWLNVGVDGAVDGSRSGQNVEGPTLPKGSESLQPALDVCLKARPALSATTPPLPKG